MLADVSKDPNLPIENPAFIAAYFLYLDKYLVSRTRLRTVRRPFDPTSLIDMELLKPVVILALVRGSFVAQSHEYLVSDNKEFVKVKWRILRKMLPFHVEQIPLVDGDDASSGGSGLRPRLDQDRRLWEYMCIVNDDLTAKCDDLLSYKRLYKSAFSNNAYNRTLCGLLMMTQAVYNPDVTARRSGQFQREHEECCSRQHCW
jgi:hypothetical protein